MPTSGTHHRKTNLSKTAIPVVKTPPLKLKSSNGISKPSSGLSIKEPVSSYRQFVDRFAAAITVLRAFTIVMLSISILVFFAVPKNSELRTAAVDPSSQLPLQDSTSTISGAVYSDRAQSSITISPRIPILYYHYIEINPNPVRDPGRNSLLITPENFEDQMLYLKDHGYTSITLDDVVKGLNDPSTLPAKPIVLTVDDGYEDFYTNAFPIIKKVGVKVTLFALSRGAEISPGFYLSNNQLKEISRSPFVTVACHTLDHSDLKGRSENFQREQIFGCKSQMEAIIGKPVDHFAYPYGDFDNTTLRLIKEAGYKTASSTIGGSRQSIENIFQLRRLHIGNYGGANLEGVIKSYHN
jgi:peptidoglycan/xylan/chitin deacetylase (PgdA/CDA1 family)